MAYFWTITEDRKGLAWFVRVKEWEAYLTETWDEGLKSGMGARSQTVDLTQGIEGLNVKKLRTASRLRLRTHNPWQERRVRMVSLSGNIRVEILSKYPCVYKSPFLSRVLPSNRMAECFDRRGLVPRPLIKSLW